MTVADFNFSEEDIKWIEGIARVVGRLVVFSTDDDRLVLPVTPWKYSVTTSQNNKVVDIIDYGEYLLFGNAKLKHLKMECFFPRMYHGYPFAIGDQKEPEECVDQIIKWKESKEPVRVIITDSTVNLMMGIMEFTYREKDGSRDLYYSIELDEYRNLNVPSANYQKPIDDGTGLRDRDTKKVPPVPITSNNTEDEFEEDIRNGKK